MKRTRRLVLAALTIATSIFSIDATGASAHSAPPSASTNVTTTYTVRSGDNLAGITRKTGIPLADLLAANNMTVTSLIHPGQTLTLPRITAPANRYPPAPAQMSPYTVVSGDYLAGISNKNGVTLKALLAANSLTPSSAIHPGQVLHVPPATKPKVSPQSSKSSPTPDTSPSLPPTS